MILLFLALLLPPTPEAEIRAVLTSQSDAWNRGDLDGYLAPYWHTDGLTFFSNGTITKGIRTHRRALSQKRYGTSKNTMGHLDFEVFDVTLMGADAAAVRGRFKLAMKDSNPTGIFTLLLRRDAGKWIIIHDHTSTDRAVEQGQKLLTSPVHARLPWPLRKTSARHTPSTNTRFPCAT